MFQNTILISVNQKIAWSVAPCASLHAVVPLRTAAHALELQALEVILSSTFHLSATTSLTQYS